jgi:hypothetical protein
MRSFTREAPKRSVTYPNDEVCSVLTCCWWRGKRLRDGYHHQMVLEAGVVQAAFRRLDQVNETRTSTDSML